MCCNLTTCPSTVLFRILNRSEIFPVVPEVATPMKDVPSTNNNKSCIMKSKMWYWILKPDSYEVNPYISFIYIFMLSRCLFCYLQRVPVSPTEVFWVVLCTEVAAALFLSVEPCDSPHQSATAQDWLSVSIPWTLCKCSSLCSELNFLGWQYLHSTSCAEKQAFPLPHLFLERIRECKKYCKQWQ